MPRARESLALWIAFGAVVMVILMMNSSVFVDALSVKIDPLSEQCFWEEVKKPNVSAVE